VNRALAGRACEPGRSVFVALRIAFSTVNDALGAVPDAELIASVPATVADVVSGGRR
jgi:hypothetical protein